MITQTDNKLNTYEVYGTKLHINFDEKEITIKDMDNKERIAYEYTTASSLIYEGRDKLIEDIIRSRYSLSGELAVMNNQTDRKEDFAEFQLFRIKAKQLADGWINKP